MNNGGRSQRALAVETSLDVLRALLELNTLGTISLTQPVVKQMQTQKDGMIVVVSSVAGKLGGSCIIISSLPLSKLMLSVFDYLGVLSDKNFAVSVAM